MSYNNSNPTIITLNADSEPNVYSFDGTFDEYFNASGAFANILTGGVSGAASDVRSKKKKKQQDRNAQNAQNAQAAQNAQLLTTIGINLNKAAVKRKKAAAAAALQAQQDQSTLQNPDMSNITPDQMIAQNDQTLQNQGQYPTDMNGNPQYNYPPNPAMGYNPNVNYPPNFNPNGNYSEPVDFTDQNPAYDGDDDDGSGDQDSFDVESGDDTQSYGVDGKKTCDPKIKDLASKVIWNNELINRTKQQNTRLKAGIKSGRGINASNSKSIVDKIKANDDIIHSSTLRVSDLYDQLKQYAGNPQGIKDIAYCFKLAKKELHSVKNKSTEVDSALNADIGKDKIVIEPESSSFDAGNGMNGNDDYDIPPAAVIELKSSADGSSSKPGFNYKGLAIGLGIAAVGILLLNKFVFKKK